MDGIVVGDDDVGVSVGDSEGSIEGGAEI